MAHTKALAKQGKRRVPSKGKKVKNGRNGEVEEGVVGKSSSGAT